jgi:hypothetical protein
VKGGYFDNTRDALDSPSISLGCDQLCTRKDISNGKDTSNRVERRSSSTASSTASNTASSTPSWASCQATEVTMELDPQNPQISSEGLFHESDRSHQVIEHLETSSHQVIEHLETSSSTAILGLPDPGPDSPAWKEVEVCDTEQVQVQEQGHQEIEHKSNTSSTRYQAQEQEHQEIKYKSNTSSARRSNTRDQIQEQEHQEQEIKLEIPGGSSDLLHVRLKQLLDLSIQEDEEGRKDEETVTLMSSTHVQLEYLVIELAARSDRSSVLSQISELTVEKPSPSPSTGVEGGSRGVQGGGSRGDQGEAHGQVAMNMFNKGDEGVYDNAAGPGTGVRQGGRERGGEGRMGDGGGRDAKTGTTHEGGAVSLNQNLVPCLLERLHRSWHYRHQHKFQQCSPDGHDSQLHAARLLEALAHLGPKWYNR